MEADSTYIYRVASDSIVSGRKAAVVEGVRRVNGYDAAEFTYILDPVTFMPLKIELENNPGQLGEQSITIRYAGNPSDEALVINEEKLADRYPDAFGGIAAAPILLRICPARPCLVLWLRPLPAKIPA